MQFNFFLFMFDSPVQIAMVVGVIFLLFGGSKLPQLAKSIGQSSRAFKEGLREAEEDDPELSSPQIAPGSRAELTNMSDESLMDEMRRRATEKQASNS